ncbi:MAG: 2-C-methyl-D-erythritol 4-phosphate cytidylyltransferase [Actinomycetota bacterium]|nr:2-C-methyl-D-erythritol 4-phosphate cytidylyltransferase [Actinomycetota bacterium]
MWAVLVAAGRGERLGADRPKAFAPLRGRPLIAEPLARLDSSEWVDAIVIVAAAGWEEPSILVSEELACDKVSESVTGGETRAESVRNGVAAVPEDAAVIVVHDAARPFLVEDVLERVITALDAEWQGAVPVLRLADTVKRVRGNEIVETLDRSELAAVQTPQAFVAPVLREALAGDLGGATDCSSLVEARGGRVRAVEGDARLLKVTDESDLALVSGLLEAAPS